MRRINPTRVLLEMGTAADRMEFYRSQTRERRTRLTLVTCSSVLFNSAPSRQRHRPVEDRRRAGVPVVDPLEVADASPAKGDVSFHG